MLSIAPPYKMLKLSFGCPIFFLLFFTSMLLNCYLMAAEVTGELRVRVDVAVTAVGLPLLRSYLIAMSLN